MKIEIEVSDTLAKMLAVCSAECGLSIPMFVAAAAITGVRAMQEHDAVVDAAVRRVEGVLEPV